MIVCVSDGVCLRFFSNSGDKMITHQFSVRRVAAFGLSVGLLATSVVGANAQSAQDTSASGTATAAQPAVQPALSAEALAIKTALERKLGSGSTAILGYAQRGFKPVWLDESGAPNQAARTLVQVLSNADDHALPVAKYQGASLAGRLSSGSPQLEADLTAAYLAYAQDVSSGLLEPRDVDRELYLDRPVRDPGLLISNAAKASNMAAFLDSLPPQDPAYRRLVERYAAFRTMAAQDIWGAPVSKGRTLRPGNKNARVAAARARLTAMGDLDPNVYDTLGQTGTATDGTQVAANDVQTDVPVRAFEPDHFDEPMVQALQRFQLRHGLNLDGVIGPATLKQLNISPRTRAEQIAVNLERMRWMNRDLGRRHILVNLAGFTMAVINEGREEFTSRVVVGKARKHRTPEFSETMTHMVVNPSWYVPTSIAQKEILPKLENDPNYLANRGMRMVNGRIIQRPGRGNALGTVKFMFPNRHAIYLHDTPSKRLFKRDVRAYSHGCVRVEKPHEFAEYLLSGQEAAPMDYFKSILRRGRERRVDLLDPLPVHLTYRSAWIDEQGIEQFRGDIYGRDRKIAQALTRAGVTILQ